MRFLPESRSKQTMILHLCGSGEYTTCVLVYKELMSRSLPHLALGVWRVSWNGLWYAGSSQGWHGEVEWRHHRVGMYFHFGTGEVEWRQEDEIAMWQFNVWVICLKIVDKTAWNFKLQKSCFSLSENLYTYSLHSLHINIHISNKIVFKSYASGAHQIFENLWWILWGTLKCCGPSNL